MTVACTAVDLVLPSSKVPRTRGIHLSGIIRAIALETGILTLEDEEEITLDDLESQAWWAALPDYAKARICMGLAWEDFYIATQLPGVIDHPGEMELDGVYMTPDGEEMTNYILDSTGCQTKLHEIKCTYKSMNTVMGKPWEDWDGRIYNSETDGPLGPLSSQYMWVTQTMGYGKGKPTRFHDLHVLFACGDYQRPIRPKAYRFEIEYSQLELDARWMQLVDYKDYRLKMRV